MNTLPGSGHKRVPPRETASFGQTAVGTGPGHPAEVREIFRIQDHAVGDVFKPLRIIATATTVQIQKPAGDVGVMNLPGILVLEFVQATTAAAVAQRLPFSASHFLERLTLPERSSGFQPAAGGGFHHGVLV